MKFECRGETKKLTLTHSWLGLCNQRERDGTESIENAVAVIYAAAHVPCHRQRGPPLTPSHADIKFRWLQFSRLERSVDGRRQEDVHRTHWVSCARLGGSVNTRAGDGIVQLLETWTLDKNGSKAYLSLYAYSLIRHYFPFAHTLDLHILR